MKNTNQQTGNNEIQRNYLNNAIAFVLKNINVKITAPEPEPFDDTACEIEIEAREFLNGIEASEATPEPAERENDETPDAPEYCRNIENDSYYTR